MGAPLRRLAEGHSEHSCSSMDLLPFPAPSIDRLALVFSFQLRAFRVPDGSELWDGRYNTGSRRRGIARQREKPRSSTLRQGTQSFKVTALGLVIAAGPRTGGSSIT